MRPPRSFIVYLQDMYDSVLTGISFIEGFGFRTFTWEKTQYTVIRAIEIIGEASKKIPFQFKKRYSGIPSLKNSIKY